MGDPKILKVSWIFFMIYLVKSSPPEDPIKCSSKTNYFNCTITNSYGAFPDRAICKAAQAVFPTTEEELISVVANATREKRKMKVATRFSHSIPKLVCPDGEDGLLISTKFLNKILRVDQDNMSITVESGVTLRQLISEAAKAGLALPYAPYWWGLTIGGLFGTGAHGSTLWGLGSSVHDYIMQLRIVTPAEAAHNYAKVRILENGNPELNAVRVSLGVLGVISQVGYQSGLDDEWESLVGTSGSDLMSDLKTRHGIES
ncbi:putative L-gulonolactone oxidase 6 [Datura stramonium]|uniref:L-gulonolactone oxidase 6 n=1 Tax=Datura stramonium TaxID=4076 RepID=A0ABS8T1N9_DATST|nr:putative L-gulonolactone oxidase 6 [Datura stramonium]